MFANLLRLITGRQAGDYDRAFVHEVREPRARESRSRRSEILLIAGWLLIALKCWATWWAIETYHVPINPGWVIAPTLGAALVCTWLYLRR